MQADADWKLPDAYGYSWLLGFYLGDECVSPVPRTFQLRVTLDVRYAEVIEDCCTAMQMVVPHACVRVRAHRHDNAVTVESASTLWPVMLPQHGPGRKHERPIVLTDWQREIVDAHPHPFLRGLIHSDGCRTINRFKTRLPGGRLAEYEYPRYFFSNRSADIRDLFREYCERLDIRTTQSNHRNISVAHRDSVAKLDAFVGPKN